MKPGRIVTLLALVVGLSASLAGGAQADACRQPDRTAEIATRGGPAYGTLQYRRMVPLAMKEVALTFDDGPDPHTTRRVLDILDANCIKATFFLVGYYAERHPEIVREIAARGHTIGTHTWSHPNNLRRLSTAAARRQIRRGFAAVEKALAAAPPADRQRLAPFFRFPGLNDSKHLMAWLGARNIATLSCEFGADDWKRIGARQVRRRAVRNIASVGRGVLILHDTKPHTAAALPGIIEDLRKRGYRFVQLAPAPGARQLAASAPDALIAPVAVAAKPVPELRGAQHAQAAGLPAAQHARADDLLEPVKSVQ
ncbi:peptidoglycan/xylan/chitin deacetylase (PgdA/CDA1 family) [Parvibaculum indicum]|uniref:polysaccharide deacetylase family protein n=1 Tax=Parvibaculum indicum TaxID=562969 RepID=UPI00141E5823|nr:polysaccharide deacetylase family protein [Parvibaculum indicum]NIJ41412.1 peptidoglycan/xylan/chitin deacetylase (PgdA/CDA1 family) [Parvibaculum indicum]